MKTRLPILAAVIALMPALCSALDLTGLNFVTGAQSSAAGSQNAVPGQVDWASGYQNSVNGNFNNVFGYQNQTIAGNLGSNFVNGASNVVGGYGNAVFANNNQTANGSIANLVTGFQNVGNGAFCMIGGLQNLVTARQSLVFGSFSNDNGQNGSVMFSDHNTLNVRSAANRFTSAGTDTFNARFNQGYFIRTNDGQAGSPNAGVFILPSVANTATTSSPAFVGINKLAPAEALDVVGNGAFTGTVTGNGSGLTNLNASNITTGTLSDSRLSGTVGLRTGGNTWIGNQTVTNSQVIVTGPGGANNNFAATINNSVNGTGGGLDIFGNTQNVQILLSVRNAIGAGMTILGTGNVGIGRSPATNQLEVEGNASKTTATAWLANSDRRIKTDIEEVDGVDALRKLGAVRTVAFHYTPEYRAAHPSIDDRTYVNVIAQEFAGVFPDSVKSSREALPATDASDPANEILQVDTYPLTIYSAAAIKELDARNTELRKKTDAQIAERDARIDELEARLSRLEKLLQSAK